MNSTRLADGGPLYFETDFDHLIVEPWNAFSSLAGFMIFAPALIVLLRSRFSHFRQLLLGGVFLGLALFFRFADDFRPPLLPSGTRWLWHLSTSAGAIFLARYLIFISDKPFTKKGSH